MINVDRNKLAVYYTEHWLLLDQDITWDKYCSRFVPVKYPVPEKIQKEVEKENTQFDWFIAGIEFAIDNSVLKIAPDNWYTTEGG